MRNAVQSHLGFPAKPLLRSSHESRVYYQQLECATLSEKNLALNGLFQFGELGTFFGALPASFATTRKDLDLGMLVTRFGSSSQARAQTSQSE
jgi:hypothetical protein